MRPRHSIAVLFAVFFLFIHEISGQIIADALPGCLNIVDQMAMDCNGSATFQFGVVGNQFVANNSDGASCSCPGGFGDNSAYFEFEPVDISGYASVDVSMAYSCSNTSYEDLSPGAPALGCTSGAIDQSHDQIVFLYSLDGGPFMVGLYVHGTTPADFTGIWTQNGLSGSTLIIRVIASNKSAAEIFYFQSLLISGNGPNIDAGPDVTICGDEVAALSGSGSGIWSGGLGIFSDPNNPNSTYTPDASEGGSQVTLTYTMTPATAACGLVHPPPSDDMVVDVISPTGSLSGGGFLCPGQCETVEVIFSSGVPPYTLDLVFSSSIIPLDFPFTIPGFMVNQTITICVGNGGIIPVFDPGTLTLTLPEFVAGNTGSLELVGLSDANCTGVIQSSSIDFTFLERPVGMEAELEECDDGSGEAVFNFTSLENTILNGNSGSVTFYEDINLSTEIFPPYIGQSTTIYAVITDAFGCTSVPIPIDLIVRSNGDAGTVLMTCDGGNYCFLCDEDGIPGESVTLTFSFDNPSINYLIDMVYFEDGVQNSFTGILPGSGGSFTFTINASATFQVVSVKPDDDCTDFTDMPAAVQVDYLIKPTLDNVGPFSDCNSITLGEITGFNLTDNPYYNTMYDGTGTFYFPGQQITQSTTIFVVDGIVPQCFDSLSFEVEIGAMTTLLPPKNDTLCGLYIFPLAPGQDTNSTVAYYTQPGGNGVKYIPGDTLFITDTLFVFDVEADCPTNEPTFSVHITNAVTFDTLPGQQNCGQIILPEITGVGLTDSVRYYTMPNGQGVSYFPGDTLRASDTLFLFDPDISCLQDTVAVAFNIGQITRFDEAEDTTVCSYFLIPEITGENIQSSAAYFTQPNGMGVSFRSGDTLWTSTRLYIFDPLSTCLENQPFFNVGVYDLPRFDHPLSIADCMDYTLPPITGSGLSPNASYYSQPGAAGSPISVGTTFSSDTTIYLFDTNGICSNEITINISIQPISTGSPNPFAVCSGSTVNLFDGLTGGLTPGGEWSQQSGTPLDVSNPSVVIIDEAVLGGNYRFAYTVESQNCGIFQSFFDLEVLVTPDLGLDTTLNTCSVTDVIDFNDYFTLTGLISYRYEGPDMVNFSGNTADVSQLMPGPHSITVYSSVFSTIQSGFQCMDSVHFELTVLDRPNAGLDSATTLCAGDSLDLNDLLSDNDAVGIYVLEGSNNPLQGGWYNSSMADSLQITIYHILELTGCPLDSAVLSIDLTPRSDAGLDIVTAECKTGQYDLFDYITGVSVAGYFEKVSGPNAVNNNVLDGVNEGLTVIRYIEGDGLVCPQDTAHIEFSIYGERIVDFSDSTCDPEYRILGETLTPANPSTSVVLQTQEGCDSTINISVQFFNASSTSLSPTLCRGEAIVINGITYDEQNTFGTDTLYGSAANGCDSILIVQLTFLDPVQSFFTMQTCDTLYSISFGNEVFDIDRPSGTAVLDNAAANGCDSLIIVDLIFNRLDFDATLVQPECEDDEAVLILDNYQGVLGLNVLLMGNSLTFDESQFPVSLPLQTGNNQITFSVGNGLCSKTETFNVDDVVSPTFVIESQTLTDSSWQLSLNIDSEVTAYFWTTTGGTLSCWDCPDPIFTGSGEVTLIFDYGNRCTDSDVITLTSIQPVIDDVYIANSISANNDGFNDELTIHFDSDIPLEVSSFSIFDRWGNKMQGFSNRMVANGDVLWDGTFNGRPVQPGVYVYQLNMRVAERPKTVFGEVTVLR